VRYMMEKGRLCFSLQKCYKTPSDKAKGKENSILYCSIFNLSDFYGRHVEFRSTGMTWNKSNNVLVRGYDNLSIIFPRGRVKDQCGGVCWW